MCMYSISVSVSVTLFCNLGPVAVLTNCNSYGVAVLTCRRYNKVYNIRGSHLLSRRGCVSGLVRGQPMNDTSSVFITFTLLNSALKWHVADPENLGQKTWSAAARIVDARRNSNVTKTNYVN